MSKKSFAAGMLFGAAIAAAEVINNNNHDYDYGYVVPTPTPQPQHQYYQGGRPVQRGCYSNAVPLYKIHQETLDVIDDIRDVCDDSTHSVGRELAYQIHNGCESGWKSRHYTCTHLARRELRDVARLAGVYSIHPHDGDSAYRRLYSELMHFINTRCEIIW